MRRLAFLIMLTLCSLQSRAEGSYRRFDDAIRKMLMSGMDTSYVCLPSTSWEIPIAVNRRAYYTRFSSGAGQIMELNPSTIDLGITVGYHGLDLMYTFALDKKSDNFYIDYYDNFWGVSVNIGNYDHNVANADACDLRSHSLNLSGYYAFFGNRYSHPATIYGNYIQKRSAGSPLLNAWYDYHSFRAGDAPLDGVAFDETGHLARIHQGAVTAGYGYNLAFLDGKIVLNANAGVGVAFPLALATNGSVGGVFWFNEHLRINLYASNYYQKSWKEKLQYLEANTWYTTLGLYYCFGK